MDAVFSFEPEPEPEPAVDSPPAGRRAPPSSPTHGPLVFDSPLPKWFVAADRVVPPLVI